MTDIEHRLRAALASVVEDAEPPRVVMDLVRRRYRRQNLRLLAAWITIIVVATSTALAAVAAKHRPVPVNRKPAPAAQLFPGGGRILFAHQGILYWLYPSGRSVPIASNLTSVILSGGKLLVSKPAPSGESYYTINLDGSHARLVLPAERDRQYVDTDVHLSPDGSRLAYIRLRNGNPAGELYAVSLATGRRSDLGPGTSFAWRDSSTIVVAADRRTLDLVNAGTGIRATYLTLGDRRLIRAYRQARPTSFAPTSIWPDSWEPGGNHAVLAVGLVWQEYFGSWRVEALIERNRDLAFAPQSTDALSVIWGPNGIFILESGDSGQSSSYAARFGSAASGRLSAPYLYFQDAALFNPAGTVAALEDSGIVSFVRVPRPGCHDVGQCPRYPLGQLIGRGEILAWVPAGPAR